MAISNLPVLWDRAAPVELWHSDPVAAKDLHWRAEVRRRLDRLAWLRNVDEDGARPRSKEGRRIAAERLAADRKRCEKSAIYFLQQYGWVKDFGAAPDRRQVPFVLWPEQKNFLVWVNRRISLGGCSRSIVPDKPREIGITWLVLWGCIIHRWLFERNFSALLGSKNAAAVDYLGDQGSLFERIRWGIGSEKRPGLLPGHLMPGGTVNWVGKHGEDKLMLLQNFENGSVISGEKVTKSFGRQKRVKLVFVDEFAEVDNSVAGSMWGSMESVGDAILVVWNAANNAGHITRRLSHGTDKMPPAPPEMIYKFEWTADPRRPPDFKARRISAGLGEDYFEQQYEGKAGAVVDGRVLDVRVEDLIYGDLDLEAIRPHFRTAACALNAWDFGSGAQSYLVSIFGMIDIWAPEPRLLIDAENWWLQTAAEDAGREWAETAAQYGGELIATGDPAGRSKESDQSSWEDRLRGEGIPLNVYDNDGWVNSLEWKHLKIRRFVELAEAGRLVIHHRCRYLREVVKNWSFAGVGTGVDIAYIDRQNWRPRKDKWGHGGDTLLYLVEAFDARATGAGLEGMPKNLPMTSSGLATVRRRRLEGARF